MLKPLPARLLRYALYLLALLLIGITILLWQAPTLIQAGLPPITVCTSPLAR
ncbi:hypothetical protein WP8S18C01_19000 [Aeromonas caviae]|nr:hypothetical protein ACGSH8M1_019360 [Aeromonas caviae]BBT52937.1 hypothetical protein WP8S18C01_19000 [Aeromonas caviae]